MLILGRRENQSLTIFHDGKLIGRVIVVEAGHGKMRIGIEGDGLRVVRTEVLEREGKKEIQRIINHPEY